MGYLIVSFDHKEIERRELLSELTIGRSPECDLSVRDVQLSRRHCQIASTPRGFILTDLKSRNGTLVNGQMVFEANLKDGDMIRLGRTRIVYRSGPLILPPSEIPKRGKSQRPLDPIEAMAGTVVGFEYTDPDESREQAAAAYPNRPYPRPRPAEPVGYAQDDIYRMLDEIASSSWDSILAENSRPVVMERQRRMPRPMVTDSGVRPMRSRRRETDLSLQASHNPVIRIDPSEVNPDAYRPRPKRRMWVAAVMIWAAAAIVMFERIPVF